MLRNPGFTLVTILTLGMGIGVNTAIFSLVNSVLLKPLPYRDGERQVVISYRPPAPASPIGFSVLELGDIRTQTSTFEKVNEYHSMDFNLVGKEEPDRVQTGVVSADWFQDLGIKPLYGRSFRADDDQPGAPSVLLLSYDFWQRRFGGDPGIVGQVLRMNDRPITVIGVLPRLPQYPGPDDVFMTTASCPFRSSERTKSSRVVRMVTLYGRLKPGVTIQQAQADLETISGRLSQAYPEAYRDARSSELAVVPLTQELTSGFRPTLIILLVIVGLVLLIACANVATMSLARMIRREQEVVVRVALGAGRRRLIRQLLTESLLLALLGGALGLAIAASSMKLLVAFANRFTVRSSEIHIDANVLLFTLGVSVVTGILFGLIPALQTSRRNLAVSLRDSGRTTGSSVKHLARNALVVSQVALSFILLMGAGLSIRSTLKLQQVDPGFNPANVLVATLSLPFSKYQTPQANLAFYEPLMSRLRSYPGVRDVALTGSVPLDGSPRTPSFKIEGSDLGSNQELPKAAVNIASGDFFHALGTPLLSGRTFRDGDNLDAMQVVIINQTLAKRYFPGQDPLGKRIALVTGGGDGSFSTIIGVVGDVHQESLTSDPIPALYFSLHQAPTRLMRVVVRTAGNPEAMAKAIRSVVHELDPEQPVADVKTLEEVRSVSMAPIRLTATLLALFAVLAFAITVIGISGVVAFSVTERTQEIGIRSALGAGRREVLELILRQGLTLVAIGLVIGVAFSLAFTRILSSVLFGVEPNDPLTFVMVGLVLAAVVSVACLMPARRAMSIDPIIALRS
jgi:predicted permease